MLAIILPYQYYSNATCIKEILISIVVRIHTDMDTTGHVTSSLIMPSVYQGCYPLHHILAAAPWITPPCMPWTYLFTSEYLPFSTQAKGANPLNLEAQWPIWPCTLSSPNSNPNPNYGTKHNILMDHLHTNTSW